jgi:hypothetical protein
MRRGCCVGRAIAGVACVVLAFAARGGAADQTPSASFGINPTRSVLAGGSAHNLFGPTRQIEVSVSILNESAERVLVLSAGFFQAIDWNLSFGLGRPMSGLTPVWEPDATCSLADRTECSTASDVRLPPQASVRGTVTLRFDSPLEVGKYRLFVELAKATTFLADGDRGRWKGGMTEQGSVDLAILPISTSRDRIAMHRAEAVRYTVKGQHQAALREFQSMAAEDPGSSDALAGMGSAFMELGRFADAAQAWERAVSARSPATGESLLPKRLAVAYMALGRDADAERVLRQHYAPEQIGQMIDEARVTAKRLKSR